MRSVRSGREAAHRERGLDQCGVTVDGRDSLLDPSDAAAAVSPLGAARRAATNGRGEVLDTPDTPPAAPARTMEPNRRGGGAPL
jgi:hypothetical protein